MGGDEAREVAGPREPCASVENFRLYPKSKEKTLKGLKQMNDMI